MEKNRTEKTTVIKMSAGLTSKLELTKYENVGTEANIEISFNIDTVSIPSSLLKASTDLDVPLFDNKGVLDLCKLQLLLTKLASQQEVQLLKEHRRLIRKGEMTT